MAYLAKQKFNINELIDWPQQKKKVLLLVGEEFLSALYRQLLEREGYVVFSSRFGDVGAVYRSLALAEMLVLDFLDDATAHKLEFLKSVSRDFPGVSVVTIGQGLDENILASLMSLGVAGHLERKFSRPHDLIHIAQTVLSKTAIA